MVTGPTQHRARDIPSRSSEVREHQNKLREGADRRDVLEYREVSRQRQMETKWGDRLEKRRTFAPPAAEGFERSGVMSNQEVRDYMSENFPEKHINNITLERVRYNDQVVYGPDGKELGHWEKEQRFASSPLCDREIVVNKPDLDKGADKQARLKDTLSHEAGHQAYDKFLKPRDQKTWTELSGSREAEQCVSNYARKDKFEDFAESYRTYVREPGTLKQTSPEKYEFMRDTVFGGREYF